MKEAWKPIPGYEGKYEVSDFGRVRSVDRIAVYRRLANGVMISVHRKHKGKLLRPGRKPSGHVSVSLGKGNSRDVHVLVLEAFVGPKPNGQEALHRNDIPNDNRLENLCWGTRSENLEDAVRNGRKPVGENHHIAKLKSEHIPIILRECERGGYGAVTRLAHRFGVTESSIRQVRDGRSWNHMRQGEIA